MTITKYLHADFIATMFQKFVDNYSRVQIFVMTSVTTAREQNTHKTLTIIILLRTLSVYVLSAYISIYFTPLQRPVLYDMSQKYSVIIIDGKIPIFEQQLQRL